MEICNEKKKSLFNQEFTCLSVLLTGPLLHSKAMKVSPLSLLECGASVPWAAGQVWACRDGPAQAGGYGAIRPGLHQGLFLHSPQVECFSHFKSIVQKTKAEKLIMEVMCINPGPFTLRLSMESPWLPVSPTGHTLGGDNDPCASFAGEHLCLCSGPPAPHSCLALQLSELRSQNIFSRMRRNLGGEHSPAAVGTALGQQRWRLWSRPQRSEAARLCPWLRTDLACGSGAV